jgi:hydrogenase maturation factor
MLIAARKDAADEIKTSLIKSGIGASVVGEFLPYPEDRIIKRKNGVKEELARPVCDNLWVALAK